MKKKNYQAPITHSTQMDVEDLILAGSKVVPISSHGTNNMLSHHKYATFDQPESKQ